MSRVALVTGGTRGIGEAISAALKTAGRTVIATYIGNKTAAENFTAVHGIETIKFDASDYGQTIDAVRSITNRLGPIEILVNNAGITRDATITGMTRDMWEIVIDTNLGSCFNLCKATFDGMKNRQFGRIVNIGSINGQAGQYGQVNYAAAKSGIHGFTKALAQEGARFGITVNAIAPGYIDTDMVRAVPPDVLKKNRHKDSSRASRQSQRYRPWRRVSHCRRSGFRYGFNNIDQRRTAYVLGLRHQFGSSTTSTRFPRARRATFPVFSRIASAPNNSARQPDKHGRSGASSLAKRSMSSDDAISRAAT